MTKNDTPDKALVEQIARKLCEFDGYDPDGGAKRGFGWIDYRDRAQILAALASNSPVETISQRQARELMQPNSGSIAGKSDGVAYNANSPVAEGNP